MGKQRTDESILSKVLFFFFYKGNKTFHWFNEKTLMLVLKVIDLFCRWLLFTVIIIAIIVVHVIVTVDHFVFLLWLFFQLGFHNHHCHGCYHHLCLRNMDTIFSTLLFSHTGTCTGDLLDVWFEISDLNYF